MQKISPNWPMAQVKAALGQVSCLLSGHRVWLTTGLVRGSAARRFAAWMRPAALAAAFGRGLPSASGEKHFETKHQPGWRSANSIWRIGAPKSNPGSRLESLGHRGRRTPARV